MAISIKPAKSKNGIISFGELKHKTDLEINWRLRRQVWEQVLGQVREQVENES